jgi:hypothetical protein
VISLSFHEPELEQKIKNLGDSIERQLQAFRDLMNPSRTNSETAKICKAKAFESFLKEYESDKSKALDEEIDEIPDDSASRSEKAAD